MHVHGPMVFVLKINWPARETVFVRACARDFDLFHFKRVNHCDACMHEKFLEILRVKSVHACMHRRSLKIEIAARKEFIDGVLRSILRPFYHVCLEHFFQNQKKSKTCLMTL